MHTPLPCRTSKSDCYCIDALKPRQNGRHFPDDIFKCDFLNKNIWISIKISLEFVPKGPINNIPALVQIMAWRRPGGKPLSEPMRVSLLTHIYVIRPQWINPSGIGSVSYGPNVVITAPADVLAPKLARPSAVISITAKLGMFPC